MHHGIPSKLQRVHVSVEWRLKAHMDLSHWSEKLPLVLLGIRSALKEDLHCTSAKLVYRTNLLLPGKFFNSTGHTDTPDPASYVAQLKVSMLRLRGSPVRKQSQRKTYISKDVVCATHVFVWHDAIFKLLQPPHDGPYRVLKPANKHYTVDIAGRPEDVSLDRLKPTSLESDLVTDVDTSAKATPTAQPKKSLVTIKRSGWCVCKLYVLASRSQRSLRGEYCSGCNTESSDTGSVPSPGQHPIGADRILYKDDEIVRPLSLSTSQRASQQFQWSAIELHHKLYVTVNHLVFILYLSHQVSSSSYKKYTEKALILCVYSGLIIIKVVGAKK